MPITDTSSEGPDHFLAEILHPNHLLKDRSSEKPGFIFLKNKIQT